VVNVLTTEDVHAEAFAPVPNDVLTVQPAAQLAAVANDGRGNEAAAKTGYLRPCRVGP
jgi:hypothetical protein